MCQAGEQAEVAVTLRAMVTRSHPPNRENNRTVLVECVSLVDAPLIHLPPPMHTPTGSCPSPAGRGSTDTAMIQATVAPIAANANQYSCSQQRKGVGNSMWNQHANCRLLVTEPCLRPLHCLPVLPHAHHHPLPTVNLYM